MRRSGRSFRLDVRQRVIVKALVCRHTGRGSERGAALAKHIRYLSRSGAGLEGEKATFFDANSDALNATDLTLGWSRDRHHFRFIVSPEHGDRLRDFPDYTREVMRRVCADLGEPALPWLAVCHFDTDKPHAHILLRGRRASGASLVIPREYIAYGFRARAQEVAQERLGDLSRLEAERRVWRETKADRFTAYDRRLLASAEADGSVADREGLSDPWSALTRGRLAHLEKLGLARRTGRTFVLATDLETRLRKMQLSRDVIRTLNQHHLEWGAAPMIARNGVRGRVVRSGFHDELGAEPYALLRTAEGVAYTRLRSGQIAKIGTDIEVRFDSRGLGRVAPLEQ